MKKRLLIVILSLIATVFVPYYLGIGFIYAIKETRYDARSVIREKMSVEIYAAGLYSLLIIAIAGAIIYLAYHYIKYGTKIPK